MGLARRDQSGFFDACHNENERTGPSYDWIGYFQMICILFSEVGDLRRLFWIGRRNDARLIGDQHYPGLSYLVAYWVCLYVTVLRETGTAGHGGGGRGWIY